VFITVFNSFLNDSNINVALMIYLINIVNERWAVLLFCCVDQSCFKILIHYHKTVEHIVSTYCQFMMHHLLKDLCCLLCECSIFSFLKIFDVHSSNCAFLIVLVCLFCSWFFSLILKDTICLMTADWVLKTVMIIYFDKKSCSTFSIDISDTVSSKILFVWNSDKLNIFFSSLFKLNFFSMNHLMLLFNMNTHRSWHSK
jgi:hypothetical protein